MSKRVSNKKGGGGARARRTWERRKFKIRARKTKAAMDAFRLALRQEALEKAKRSKQSPKRTAKQGSVFSKLKRMIGIGRGAS